MLCIIAQIRARMILYNTQFELFDFRFLLWSYTRKSPKRQTVLEVQRFRKNLTKTVKISQKAPKLQRGTIHSLFAWVLATKKSQWQFLHLLVGVSPPQHPVYLYCNFNNHFAVLRIEQIVNYKALLSLKRLLIQKTRMRSAILRNMTTHANTVENVAIY